MRKYLVVPGFLALLTVLAPAAAHAQFQAPTNEELKMTADPKVPDASAVYLNFSEVANDPMHFQRFYARIKVLQEKGKELATVQVPYFRGNTKIAEIKGRTIHSDGTIVPLQVKPEDLLTVKSGEVELGRVVFTLPSVEVGSILEYEYTIRYDDNRFSSPEWDIQRGYYVHKAHYVFTPFASFLHGQQSQSSNRLVNSRGEDIHSLLWWPVLPPGVAVKNDVTGCYIVDINDVPPLPHEDWMPPEKSYRYKVQFYYASEDSPKEFWAAAAKRWSKDVDHFAEPSKAIHEAVDAIVAASDTPLDKAKKLYKAVQALDNTDYSRKKNEAEMKQLNLKEAKRAEDTWAQKSGDSEDIALLYLAMARAAGVNAKAMRVADRERGIFDLTYMNVYQLVDTVVVLNIDGKEMTVDPGEKMCPFQTVHWRHSFAGGFTQNGEGSFASTTQPQVYTENKTTRIGEITLDAKGAMTGNFRISMTGQEALHWRQMALRNDEAEVTKSFDRWLETITPQGVEARVDQFLGIGDENVNLVAIVKAHGTLGAVTSKRLMLPGYFFETRNHKPFVDQENRQTSVDMHYGSQINDQVTYHLPEGMTVEGAPKDNKISWAGHAMLVNKSASSVGKITIARSLSQVFTLALPDEYQDLRGFYKQVEAADQQQVVLTTASAGAGNE